MNDFVLAGAGGVLGTIIMTAMMLGGKHLNLPAVDAHGILGFMLNKDHASPVGYIVHIINGVIFGVFYALVFQNIPGNTLVLGIIGGVVHWLAVGWMFAFAPLVHAGMKAGTVESTGAYMFKSLGYNGFIAGMIGHIIFGIIVTAVYVAGNGTLAA